MTRRSGAMHVETSRSHQVLRDGTERVYQRHLLRRSYRDGGKVRKETLANLSHLPADEVYAAMDWLAARQHEIEAALAGRHLRQGGMALFDLSSSQVEGTHCELA